MNWIIEKTYVPFLILIPIILIMGFLNRKETLDINVHDTYYVINNFHLAIILSTVLGIISLGYFLIKLFNIPLINWLSITHVIISILGIIIIYILFKVVKNLEVNTSNIESFFKYSKTIQRINFALFSALTITIISQLLFLLNITVSIIKKKL
ncbi:hypothetical protein [uncultured Flavobacterium sp.]|uniref:hypothetical protein n=1 Tax=uncultured Flavobacterium sp. TaxID=165435 RepID=UPI0030C828E1